MALVWLAPASSSAEPRRLVTPCEDPGHYDAARILAQLPDRARGELVWFADHNQVIIVEADIGFARPPLLVMSRRDGNYFVTSIRRDGDEQRVRSAPLAAARAEAVAAAFLQPMPETHEHLADGVTGWDIEFANGGCLFVRQDFFQSQPGHWTVSLLWALTDLAEARGKRATRRAEAGIDAALAPH